MELNCRACLQVGSFMISIFEEVDQYKMSIKQLVEIIGGLEIVSDDDLPKYLCENCTQELLAAVKFRKKCQESLEVLIKTFRKNDEIFKNLNKDNTSENTELYVEDNTENEFSNDQVKHSAYDDMDSKDLTTEIRKLEDELLGTREPLPHVCYFCGAAYQRVTFLKRHIEREHDVSAVCCKICKKICRSELHLKNHTCKIADRPFSRKFVCLFCDKTLESEIDLKTHQKKHTGDRPFQCFCGKTFKTRQALVTHRMRHENPNSRNMCNICNRIFSEKHKLVAHMVVHIDVHPHICWTCRKSFSTKNALREHMQKHNELPEHPFKCTVCSCPFAKLEALENHMELHINHKTFQEIYTNHVAT